MNHDIRLPDDLPDSYHGNLCDLPPRQYQAIQEDKIRWGIARKKLQTERARAIRAWLDTLPDHVATDMRRRLNHIRSKR